MKLLSLLFANIHFTDTDSITDNFRKLVKCFPFVFEKLANKTIGLRHHAQASHCLNISDLGPLVKRVISFVGLE